MQYLAIIRLALLQPAIIVLAIILVRFQTFPFDDLQKIVFSWQEIVLIVIAALDGAFSGAYHFLPMPNMMWLNKKILLPILLRLCFFLYVAAAVLSEKLLLGSSPYEWIKILAVLFLAIGFVLRWLPLPYSIKDPKLIGFIYYLIGLPLIFGSWLTVAAVPGAIIVVKWLSENNS
jgi:protein-S-isoprenylcysteine O-methyltransferase Ste14